MSDTSSPDWTQQLNDPYAVLGVSVAADERRILKRYRQIAKQLHPDIVRNHDVASREFAQQALSRLINPAYQRIKQDKGRNETLATLRFKVRRLTREQTLKPKSDVAQALMKVPEAEVDIFYEQTLEQISRQQFESAATFNRCIRQLRELNLVYFRRKMGEPVIRAKRTGLVAKPETATSSNSHFPEAHPPVETEIDYAARHYQRAQQYLKNRNYSAAIQELKDAVRISPRNSDYHCLLGQAYLLNQLPGMARVHIKQALRLNPRQPAALKLAQRLDVDPSQVDPSQARQATQQPSAPAKSQKQGLFGGLFSRK